MNDPVILLIENNPDDVALVHRALKRNHIANPVVIAESGQEALDYLNGTGPYQGRDLGIMPVLVLLSMRLPGMSGLELLQRLRAGEETAGLPVVALTSSKGEDDLARTSTGHLDGYLRKTIDFQDLVTVIREAGLYWLLLKVPAARKAL